jgi:hypothetical protein
MYSKMEGKIQSIKVIIPLWLRFLRYISIKFYDWTLNEIMCREMDAKHGTYLRRKITK